MKSYSKFLILVVGVLIVYVATVNSFRTVTLSEDENIKIYNDDYSGRKTGESDSSLQVRSSIRKLHEENFAQLTIQSSSLEDWQVFIRDTLKEYEGDECMIKLYQYGDQQASYKNFDRVGYINEIIKFKGDTYEVNSIMCNIYSRRIDVSETQFLEEVSSFYLSDIHKEFFYSAVITSPVIQHADVEKLKLFIQTSTNTILNKYISDVINAN